MLLVFNTELINLKLMLDLVHIIIGFQNKIGDVR